jgi:hypothetical protein
MKQKLGEEYLNCTKSILKTKLNGKNMIKAINAYTTPVLTFSFGIVKWMPTDLENLQTKTRTLLLLASRSLIIGLNWIQPAHQIASPPDSIL